MTDLYEQLFTRLFEAKVDARRLDPSVLDDDIQPMYPDILPEDYIQLKTILEWAVAAGLMSEETATAILPWDINYEDEQRKRKNEQAERLKAAGGVPEPENAHAVV